MRNIFQFIISAGIGENTHPDDIKKIRLLNIIALLGITISFGNVVIFRIIGIMPIAIANLWGVFCFAIPFIINYNSFYKTARITASLGIPLYMAFGALYVGEYFGIEYFIWVTFIAPVMFYEKKSTIIPLLLYNVVLFFVVKLVFYYSPSPASEYKLFLNFFNFSVIFFVTYYIVNIFKNENKAYEKIILERNQTVTDSIQYALRIQKALSSSETEIKQNFADAFVFLKPKNIVSGDFFWFAKIGNLKILIVSDCTGHGIPGAFMTVLGFSLLNEIVIERKITSPEIILNELDSRIISNLKQLENKQMNDGMDISVLVIDDKNQMLHFAGAKSNAIFIRNSEPIALKGSKFAVGGTNMNKPKLFEKQSFEYKNGDRFYMHSDGFPDQFGGNFGRKYLSKNFREFIINNSILNFEIQKQELIKELENWQGMNFFNTRKDNRLRHRAYHKHIAELSKLPSAEAMRVLKSRLEHMPGTTPQTDDIIVVGILL